MEYSEAPSPSSSGFELLDVLPVLPPPAAQTVLETLRGPVSAEDSSSSVRLSCRTLRDFVDCNLTDVLVKLETSNPQIWTTEYACQLQRFSSLTSVNLSIRGPKGDHGLADLVVLPFHALPPEILSRFQGLRIAAGLNHNAATDGEAALARLASLLPNLRKLDAGCLRGMTYDPAPQQQMFSALASLSHLEDLILPSTSDLDCVGSLAHITSLRRLAIHDSSEWDILSRQALAGICQLQHLTELAIGGGLELNIEAAGDPLLDILDHLPDSLQYLNTRFQTWATPHLPFKLRLNNGRLDAVKLSDEDSYDVYDSPSLSHMAHVARQLLACRQMPAPPARVRLLDIDTVCLGVPETAPAENPELQPLWDFLQRCEQVQLRRFDVSPDPQYLPATIEALALLGKPEVLSKDPMSSVMGLRLRGKQDSGDWAAGARAEQEPGQRDPAGPPAAHGAGSLPTLAQAVERLVEALSQHPADAEGGAAASPGATALDKDGAPRALQRPAHPDELFNQWVRDLASRMLLLRGAAVGVMAQAPDALHQWLIWLDGQAAASLGGQENEEGGAESEEEGAEDEEGQGRRRRLSGHVVSHYQLLPAPASLLLIECRSSAGRAGATAMAAAVAAAAAAAVAEGQPAGVLEVLQDIWDQHAARLRAGGSPPLGGELALLRRLLELAVALTPVRFGE